MLTPAYDDGTVSVFHCAHEALAAHLVDVGGPDALCSDPPYSRRTHDGHDGGAASANRPLKANGVRDTGRARREIEYGAWTHADVEAFVDTWSPLVHGWLVALTDGDLANDYRGSYETNGRLSFQPVPCVERGATVRLCGGGPSSWATYAMVSRPRSRKYAAWPTLPGSYEGPSERKPWVGGKPEWLVAALLRDYTREGDLVCDPCLGGGTAAICAMRLGRRFVGCDVDEKAVAATIERVREERRRAEAAGRQVALWQPPRGPKAKQVPLGDPTEPLG